MWFTSIGVLITMLTLISVLMRRVLFPQVWYSMGGLFSQQNSDLSPQIVMPGCPHPLFTPACIAIATHENGGLHFVLVYNLVVQCPKLDDGFFYPYPLLLHFHPFSFLFCHLKVNGYSRVGFLLVLPPKFPSEDHFP